MGQELFQQRFESKAPSLTNCKPIIDIEMQNENTGKWSKVLLNNFPEVWMCGFKINDSRLLEMNSMSHLILWVSRERLIGAHKFKEIT